jgi:hypothetical protein
MPACHGFAMMRAKPACHGLAMMWASPTQLSSGLRPDDAGKARMSWPCHDVGFAHTSSGLRPDDQIENEFKKLLKNNRKRKIINTFNYYKKNKIYPDYTCDIFLRNTF